jgi:hypothetical protein
MRYDLSEPHCCECRWCPSSIRALDLDARSNASPEQLLDSFSGQPPMHQSQAVNDLEAPAFSMCALSLDVTKEDMSFAEASMASTWLAQAWLRTSGCRLLLLSQRSQSVLKKLAESRQAFEHCLAFVMAGCRSFKS